MELVRASMCWLGFAPFKTSVYTVVKKQIRDVFTAHLDAFGAESIP